MRANVHKPYTLLSLCAEAVYSLFAKRITSKELTDGVGFEPTVRYERTHTFQACSLNHSSTRPITHGLRTTGLRAIPLSY